MALTFTFVAVEMPILFLSLLRELDIGVNVNIGFTLPGVYHGYVYVNSDSKSGQTNSPSVRPRDYQVYPTASEKHDAY